MRKSLLPKNLKAKLVTLCFLALLFIPKPGDTRRDDPGKLDDATAKNLVPANSTDPALLMYKKVDDSLRQIVHWKKKRLSLQYPSIFSHYSFLGAEKIIECDSCIRPGENFTAKYFISVDGFALKKEASFRIEKNEYFVEKADPVKRGTTQLKKTGVRLAKSMRSPGELALLIPVSSGLFQVIEIFMTLLYVVLAVAGGLLVFVLPYKVLKNIADGRPFEKKNITYLNWAGWTLIGGSLLMVVLPRLIELFLSSMIPGEIYFPFWTSLYSYRWAIFIGFAFLLFAGALKEGLILKHDQDLIN